MNNMHYAIDQYKGTDKMSDLICSNYTMLQVMSRFGIPLGFGDDSIQEVCEKNNVDCKTFIAVINILNCNENRLTKEELEQISVQTLMDYLKQSHIYFLEFKLPSIRRKLIESINLGDNDISIVIMRYYDTYVNEVRKHMDYEDQVVFPHVTSLLRKRSTPDYNIGIFSKKHDKVESKLSELKDIIIKYYPAETSNELNCVLFDIFACADELFSHNAVEDLLFIPAIRNIEGGEKA